MRKILVGLGTILVLVVGVAALVEAPRTSDPLPIDCSTVPALADDSPFAVKQAGFTPVPFPLPPSTCGGNVCGPGTYCCNPSCGTCTPFGAYCTQQVCNPTF